MTTSLSTSKGLPHLKAFFEKRLAKNTNCFFLVYSDGKSGVGKSYLALWMAQCLQPSFSVSNVCFNMTDFIYLVNTLPPGSIIVFDDAGVEGDSRTFLSKNNLDMRHVIESMRSRLISVFFTVPGLDMIDATVRHMSTMEIRVMSHGLAKAYGCKYNRYHNDYYYPFLFYIGHPRNKNLRAPLPTKEVLDAYEEKKYAFQSDLYSKILSRREHEVTKQEKKEKHLSEPDIAKKIIAEGLDKYLGPDGKLDKGKIAGKFHCGTQKALGVARIVNSNIVLV